MIRALVMTRFCANPTPQDMMPTIEAMILIIFFSPTKELLGPEWVEKYPTDYTSRTAGM
jgi:hypothetical protein